MSFSFKDIEKSRNEYKFLDSLQSLQKGDTKDIMLLSLLEVTKGINNNFSEKQLLRIFEYVLNQHMKVGKLVLFRYESHWKCILHYGTTDEHKQIEIENDLLYLKSLTHTSKSLKAYLNVFSTIIPVFHKSKPLAYLLIGDIHYDEKPEAFREKQIPFIEVLTNIIAVALENKVLARERLKQERIRKELELAGEMQALLIPSTLPSNEYYEMAAIYRPNQEVGGDYYDFSERRENELSMCIADVSGKGVSAALLMSNFQANLRAIYRHTDNLIDMVTELNTAVMESARGERFITFFIGLYNKITRTFRYINAGHNPPVLHHADGAMLLKTGCPGLGMFESIPHIKEGVIQIPEGSTLVCYTDGIIELEDELGKDFGVDGLTSVIDRYAYKSVDELNKLIFDHLDLHKGEGYFLDDVALFSCRFF
ncbi:MAG: SpoIIE family protein phosphatase [Flavobacteriales bacterium]|nr:SpoIIE family protein phosphatase [Flavobacteriales bacterium]MCB9446899.1 SpoIIE family protein phosphatase [Flavobacteriales bacterium]